jgi:hypothetical protein
VHDFTGGILPSGLTWTVPIPDESIAVSGGGKRLDVDVRDVAVIDSTGAPTTDVPASVSFQMTWRGRGGARRRGLGLAVGSGDPSAFVGRFFSAKAQGTFSGVSGGALTFTSSPKPRLRTIFAVLGSEQTGALIPGSAGCDACAHAPPTVPAPAEPW